MRVGIDLGTTRTLVAACDRGNYPIVGFEGEDGDIYEHVPTVSAEVGGRLVHGHAAERALRDGAPSLRSYKRMLGRFGPEHVVRIGACEVSLFDLTRDFLSALAQLLLENSNLPGARGGRGRRGSRRELPEAVVSVPANAHSSQRFTTLEAYRAAGFVVRAVINEPSAAAIEYAHRHRGSLSSRRDHVAIYDLGGGTFDAALVMMADDHHDVIETAGVQHLGGDDFDEALLAMCLEKLGARTPEPGSALAMALSECRAAKEGIGPNSRRVVVDLRALDQGEVVVDVAEYYERLRPLVARSVDVLGTVMAPRGSSQGDDPDAPASEAGVAGVYVVGGGSGLPIVGRILREHFGRRVHRSTYPAAATAMGLAIAADEGRTTTLQDRFTRHLGVFREREAGSRIAFDRIFARGTPVPASGRPPLVATREYRAMHNVGHFRFVECAELGVDDEPRGDITPHGTVLFPFSEALRSAVLERVAIARLEGDGPRIHERYEVDDAGIVAVTIENVDDGYRQRFVLNERA